MNRGTAHAELPHPSGRSKIVAPFRAVVRPTSWRGDRQLFVEARSNVVVENLRRKVAGWHESRRQRASGWVTLLLGGTTFNAIMGALEQPGFDSFILCSLAAIGVDSMALAAISPARARVTCFRALCNIQRAIGKIEKYGAPPEYTRIWPANFSGSRPGRTFSCASTTGLSATHRSAAGGHIEMV